MPASCVRPFRIGPESGPWPLHDVPASKALEAHALARTAPLELMERAGLAVARLARAMAPAARSVQVWCGPGNNGGDGYVAARLLHTSGTTVAAIDCAPGAQRPADAQSAFEQARASGVRFLGAEAAAADPPDLVIDALLGLGTSRAPQGRLADAVAAINALRVPVLAIDLPTGLHGDTGQPLGLQAVCATHTLALLTLKPGLFTARGRDLAGHVWFDDLNWGDPDAAPADAGATARLLGPLHRRSLPHASHKGSRGDLWVVGGAEGMVGAARLAARAGLAAGAGRVYVTLLASQSDSPLPGDLSPRGTQAALAGPSARPRSADHGETGGAADLARPELMHRQFTSARQQLLGTATVVAGCGGGEAIRPHLPVLLAEAPRLVLDADALNALALEPALQRLLEGRAARGQGTVLTPHPLEAARLLRTSSATVQADRIAHAHRLAEQTRCTVVLKGSGTVIAGPGVLPAINPSGNAALASAGTGDVLAGWLGGLWAQAPDRAAYEIACQAAWQHGHAADVAQSTVLPAGAPLLANDLIDVLARTA